VTVVLLSVDFEDEGRNYTEWSNSLREADSFLISALHCLPLESNLWLRLAAVRSLIAEDPDEVAKFMTVATDLAPADETAILSRLYFWNRFSALTLSKSNQFVIRDIRLAFNGSTAKSLSSTLEAFSPNLAQYALSQYDTLPVSRQHELYQGFKALRDAIKISEKLRGSVE